MQQKRFYAELGSTAIIEYGQGPQFSLVWITKQGLQPGMAAQPIGPNK